MTDPEQLRIVWATDEQRAVDRQIDGCIMLGARVLLTFAPGNASAALRMARQRVEREREDAALFDRPVGVEIAELEQLEVVHGLRPYAPKENP